ncbi:MAG: hypothetical protein AAB658_15230, partial [Chloroflexota bacterium]
MKLKADDEYAASTINCPGCNTKLQVPASLAAREAESQVAASGETSEAEEPERSGWVETDPANPNVWLALGLGLGIMAAIVPAALLESDPLVRLGTADQLVTAQLNADYLPVFDSPSADVQGQIVFVGHGIVDPARGIDDYAGVDVANHIVLFLRGKPDQYPKPVSHAGKVRLARDHGALGYLTATGPILNPYDARRGVTGKPSAFYGQLPPDQAIPGAW